MTNGQGGTFHPTDPRLYKRSLRARMAAIRERLATPERGNALCDRVSGAFFISETTLAGYWPIRSEIDVRPVLRRALDQGLIAALPAGTRAGTPLVFRSWCPEAALVSGLYGIPEPAADRPAVVPSLLLVPLLAFDRFGFRLGYGGGFYDRTLASLRRSGRVTAVGVALEGLEVDAVPHDRYDQRLDWIVTEDRLWRIAKEDGV